MRAVFDEYEFELVLLETGYRKPLSSLLLSDRPAIVKTLKIHVLVKVKPELDQFIDGLNMYGILESIKKYPSLMAQYFTHIAAPLTVGMLVGT